LSTFLNYTIIISTVHCNNHHFKKLDMLICSTAGNNRQQQATAAAAPQLIPVVESEVHLGRLLEGRGAAYVSPEPAAPDVYDNTT
jgi:hypothetical protein